MTTAADTQIVPRPPPSLPELRAADQRVADGPGVRPLRQHQARLRRPVEVVQRLVRLGGPARPAGRSTDGGALPGGPRR